MNLLATQLRYGLVVVTALLCGVLLVAPVSIAADDGSSAIKKEETYRSFPQLMMRLPSTKFSLPDDRPGTSGKSGQALADKFRANLQAEFRFSRFTIGDHDHESPEIHQWCDRVAADLQTYRKQLDADTGEAELSIEAKEFQCSEAYSYRVDFDHGCRNKTKKNILDGSTADWKYCTVDVNIEFRKYKADFDEEMPALGGSNENSSLASNDAQDGPEMGRMVWTLDTDFGQNGVINVHTNTTQRLQIVPGKEAETKLKTLEWTMKTVLSDASGLLAQQQDMRPKGVVQSSKGSTARLCLSKDIVALDAPFRLFDQVGDTAGFMKAREIHDGCELTPSLVKKIRDKRARRIELRARLGLNRLGTKGKEVGADISDGDWDPGFMKAQVLLGDATNRFGMGYFAQELPYSGWSFVIHGGAVLTSYGQEQDDAKLLDGLGVGGGLGFEVSLAAWSGVSELHNYGSLSFAAFSEEDKSPGSGISLEYGVLRRWYVLGPLFWGAGAGLNVGYFPSTKTLVGTEDPDGTEEGEGSVFGGASAHVHLGFLVSSTMLIDLRVGYQAGLVHHLGRSDQVLAHGPAAGLGINISL